MEHDIKQFTQDLLIQISNALYERPDKIEICFNSKENQLVEEWLESFLIIAQSPK